MKEITKNLKDWKKKFSLNKFISHKWENIKNYRVIYIYEENFRKFEVIYSFGFEKILGTFKTKSEALKFAKQKLISISGWL